MKITKKIIILLIVLIGMLILGMSEVNAQSLPKKDGKVDVDTLESNGNQKYFIGYSQDYLTCSNLHCAQKGQRLWSSRYKL